MRPAGPSRLLLLGSLWSRWLAPILLGEDARRIERLHALQNPERAPDPIRDTIEAACRDGGTTFFSGGIDPGFGNDLLPLTLLGLCGRLARAEHSIQSISNQTDKVNFLFTS